MRYVQAPSPGVVKRRKSPTEARRPRLAKAEKDILKGGGIPRSGSRRNGLRLTLMGAGSPDLIHGCPVEFCWTIPLGSGRFADDPDTRRGINAMHHPPLIPWRTDKLPED
jgi:hypothetical protein